MRAVYQYVYSHTCFSVFMLVFLACLCGILEWMAHTVFASYKKFHIVWKGIVLVQLSACMLLFLYAALFSRRVTAEPKYELHLFWSYKKAIHSSSSFLVRQILYNILAFVPLGNALNYLMDEKREWKRVLAVFVLASLGVELIQLIFHLGLFEFDDIFNNLLGGILGYALAESMRKILKWNREKQENDI